MDLGRLALFRSIEGVRGARFVLALLSGVAFASVSPPFDFVSALWVGMAGLAYLLEASTQRPARLVRRLAEGGARGMAFGVGANLVALRFVPDTITRFTPLPWAAGMLALILLAAEQSLRWIAAAWVRGALVRWRVSSPLAFAAGVYAGTFVPVIFPWNPAGGATLRPELLQLADTIGERGVSALMALAAGFAGSALRALHNDGRAYANRRTLAKCAAALALPLVTYVHGRFRMAEVEALRGGA
ncbi:MAG TPA: apolipoprotein N-acyltransferase, partial [Polyangiaceae bacterium]|nr:apolipoprotein N-acyltransferase [Polyangiaceae bacterium]